MSPSKEKAQLPALAEARQWPDIYALMEREKSPKALLKHAAVLEQIGTQRIEARVWIDAILCFQIGQWPAMYGGNKKFPEAELQQYYTSVYQMNTKLQDAMARGAAESGFWDGIADVAIVIAASGRLGDADQILNWLRYSTDRQWAARFETAAQTGSEEFQLWLLGQAQDAYSIYAAADGAKKKKAWQAEAQRVNGIIERIEEGPEPPEEAVEANVDTTVEEPQASAPSVEEAMPRLADLTHRRKFEQRDDLLDDEYFDLRDTITATCQAEGDRLHQLGETAAALDMYSIAVYASSGASHIKAMARDILRAGWERKLATPVSDEQLPEPLNWDTGMDRVEWLALSGRTGDADELLHRLKSVLGKPRDLCINAGESYDEVEYYFKDIANHVRGKHPEIARWFKDRAEDGLFSGPAKKPAARPRGSALGVLLARLEELLEENEPAYLAELLPGAKPADFAGFEDEFHLQLPADFRELYSWRNGQPGDNYDSFDGNRMFESLQDIAETKRALDDLMGASWVPFLHNGAGDYLCYDLETGRLVAYWHADEDRPVEFDSLKEWLEQLCRA